MIGSIAGDIIGSTYEFLGIKSEDFLLFPKGSWFTDDSVLTVAVADAILKKADYGATIHAYGRNYPGRGYGGLFASWLKSDGSQAYSSYGNGSAMRVSAVGFAFDDLETVLEQARLSALPTHDHPEGVKGAQVTAGAVFLARTGAAKDRIREWAAAFSGYDLSRTVSEIRAVHTFNETCQGNVPEALSCFFESTDYEDAVRKAISIGGDADTLAAITGGIAQAFYGEIPAKILAAAMGLLDEDLKRVINAFSDKYHAWPKKSSLKS
jgi:ADP-ribosylglycohydrolase